jgi:Zn finger protein HypA/HybF involved in hydrogenase expression
MHEVSLVQSLFDQADHAIPPHPAAAVRLVTVCIGALAGVERELFLSAFDGCKEDRGYGNAALEIIPSAGSDLILQRLELETPDV